MSGGLITIDGPAGVGISSTVKATVELLRKRGLPAIGVAHPSPTPLGTHLLANTGNYCGHALACLNAGDRHQQQHAEIGPELAVSHVVCDRYVPSDVVSFVQGGLPAETVWAINNGARVPDLAILLRASPEVIIQRRAGHGACDPLEQDPTTHIVRESGLFDLLADDLRRRGWNAAVIDCSTNWPYQTAEAIVSRFTSSLNRLNPVDPHSDSVLARAGTGRKEIR